MLFTILLGLLVCVAAILSGISALALLDWVIDVAVFRGIPQPAAEATEVVPYAELIARPKHWVEHEMYPTLSPAPLPRA